MKKFLSLTILTLGLASAANLNAQVTYTPNMSLSDFSGVGVTGGTASIYYELVGSPADTPYGSSFSVDVHIGAITVTGETATSTLGFHVGQASIRVVDPVTLTSSPALVPTPVSIVSPNTFRLVVDKSALLATDLQAFDSPAYSTLEEFGALMHQLILDGLVLPQYTFSMTAETLPSASGWTGDSGSFSGSFSRGGGVGTGPPGYVRWTSAITFDASPYHAYGFFDETAFGDTLTTSLYFAYDPSVVTASSALNNINLTGNERYATYQFQDLTFSPVPEPGGALLVMASGLILMFCRRRPDRAGTMERRPLP